MAASLEVLRPGLLTSIQDLGRWGHQAVGVPVAGAMDTRSLRWANVLVGNDEAAAALEVTLIGPTLRARGGSMQLAVAGASFDVRVDDRPVATDRVFMVQDGQRVSFGQRHVGARSYLAVRGGFDTPPVLGSRSTHLVSRMGGVAGRAIRPGDVLPVGAMAAVRSRPLETGSDRARACPPDVLRVLLGPQDAWFTREAVEALVGQPFAISSASDRMGFRLEGPRLATSHAGQLLSEPVAFGAIQVPASGAPILLMADRQTAGGYPKIATVIAADLPAAGQLAPGDVVRFAACSRREAMAALIAEERSWLRATASEGEP